MILFPLTESVWTLPGMVLAAVSVGLALVLAALRLNGREAPLVAWLVPAWLPGVSSTIVGLIGLWDASIDMAAAAPDQRPVIAAEGLSSATMGWAMGWLWAFLGMVGMAWIAALSSLIPAGRWRFAPAVGAAAALGCVAAGFQALGLVYLESQVGALLTLLAGLPVAVALLREDEGDARRPELRAATLVLAVTAAAAGTAMVFSSHWGLGANALMRSSYETRQIVRSVGLPVRSLAPLGWPVLSMAVVGVVAWLAQLTWGEPRDHRRIGLSTGLALAGITVGSLGVVAGLGQARALWDASIVLWWSTQDDIDLPRISEVQPPTHEMVLLMVTPRDVVAAGRWQFDINSGRGPLALPSNNLRRDLASNSTTLVAQVDRRTRWSLFEPILREVRAAGYERVELVVVGPDSVGVVELPLDRDFTPDTTIEEILADY